MKAGASMHEQGTHERGRAHARTNKSDVSTCEGARWHKQMVRARTNEGGHEHGRMTAGTGRRSKWVQAWMNEGGIGHGCVDGYERA
jgi:hypothetical protein